MYLPEKVYIQTDLQGFLKLNKKKMVVGFLQLYGLGTLKGQFCWISFTTAVLGEMNKIRRYSGFTDRMHPLSLTVDCQEAKTPRGEDTDTCSILKKRVIPAQYISLKAITAMSAFRHVITRKLPFNPTLEKLSSRARLILKLDPKEQPTDSFANMVLFLQWFAVVNDIRVAIRISLNDDQSLFYLRNLPAVVWLQMLRCSNEEKNFLICFNLQCGKLNNKEVRKIA